MPAPYNLTQAAKRDLRAIWRYTVSRWGEEQADRYLGRLEHCFARIATGEVRPKTFSITYPQAQVIRCEHHYVFYLPSPQVQPVIIAVLHENMDMIARIQGRLEI